MIILFKSDWIKLKIELFTQLRLLILMFHILIEEDVALINPNESVLTEILLISIALHNKLNR